MRRIYPVLVFAFAGVSAAWGQQGPTDGATVVPRFDLSLGYNHVNANAPPGVSNYFGPNGGYASGQFYLKHWFSIAGEFTGGRATNISALGQNLTLLTFMGGPRISLTSHRLVPYGQILFGGAHGSDSYFPSGSTFSISATSWAFSAGGGVDINLTHRLAIRAIEAQYMRTVFPNGSTDEQNHLMVGAGVVIKFGGHYAVAVAPPVPVAEARPGEISFNCTTSVARVEQGDTIQIVGHTMTEPDKLEVNYSWSSTGGMLEGSGRLVTINTVGLAPGEYRVMGHASLSSSPSSTANCEARFEVTKRSEPVVMNDAARAKEEQAFHENVPDALFDYDSYTIRPDAQTAISGAARYLNDHPEIRVRVEGYADDRGSAEYNLALGQKRANAAREALIAAGVAPDRVEIVSYGKEAQVCTDQDEACWQRNRRAAFSMHP